MVTPSEGALGGIDFSEEQRRELAEKSRAKEVNFTFGSEKRREVTRLVHEKMLGRMGKAKQAARKMAMEKREREEKDARERSDGGNGTNAEAPTTSTATLEQQQQQQQRTQPREQQQQQQTPSPTPSPRNAANNENNENDDDVQRQRNSRTTQTTTTTTTTTTTKRPRSSDFSYKTSRLHLRVLNRRHRRHLVEEVHVDTSFVVIKNVCILVLLFG
jgi:hypothetical protein